MQLDVISSWALIIFLSIIQAIAWYFLPMHMPWELFFITFFPCAKHLLYIKEMEYNYPNKLYMIIGRVRVLPINGNGKNKQPSRWWKSLEYCLKASKTIYITMLYFLSPIPLVSCSKDKFCKLLSIFYISVREWFKETRVELD